ncbi:NAD(P)-dependent malic enzyme [Acidimangrovimonas pyrenivorans]|uniref:NADP-dependent malic enzyme n=1 Tax=Acidimangrovimonas pyrenivorans TaxID=2030798 RepID=A0ABV7AH58_9RHOB
MSQSETRSSEIAAQALDAHRRWHGKMQTLPKCPVRGIEDFALWYTPGVAAAARAVAEDPAQSFALTDRGDRVAIVSDGSRVLGLGDIGPEAALPVMEGKALLFKYLGGVDATALCIDRHGIDEIVDFVQAIGPSFGGVNLEDIATPKCFRVLERLQAALPIPVWHDDQQGTAAAALAGLLGALEIVGKAMAESRITLIGAGAANVSVYRLLKAAGADPAKMRVCDSAGLLHQDRVDISADRERLREKWTICRETNPDRHRGGIVEALAGADVCIAFSAPGPGLIPPEAIAGMTRDAIVFACANPTPEIWPEAARQAGARIVATGRSDFANQVNNALVFPGLFRGVLDIRARRISDRAALAAARALVGRARALGLGEQSLLPPLDDIAAAAAVAGAAAAALAAEGEAGIDRKAEWVREATTARILAARAATALIAGPDGLADGLAGGLSDGRHNAPAASGQAR